MIKVPMNLIIHCQEEDVWSLGNDLLYRLCKEHPKHVRQDEIIAKIWLIGRAYAAAIERRKPAADEPTGDDFYLKVVAPALADPIIDTMIEALQNLDPMSESAVAKALNLHFYLLQIFSNITKLNKRSLASKYLHFHLPQYFYLYDIQATVGLRKTMDETRSRVKCIPEKNVDVTYSRYFRRVNELREAILNENGVALSPRQIDRLLLSLADE